MKINNKGYWENETSEGHEHDEKLSNSIVNFFNAEKARTIIDMGCGTGYYIRKLLDSGFIAVGVDGNPHTEKLSKGLGKTVDLSIRQYLGRFDWVLSLEVGEHIPQEFENAFIDNLDRHNKYGMVISWAIRGQGGDGHVNCLDNWEVAEKILPLGYTIDGDAQAILRHSCAQYPHNGWWFRNTIMVFRRIK